MKSCILSQVIVSTSHISLYESSVAFPVLTNPCRYSMRCCDLSFFLILPKHCFHFLNLYQCFHIFIFFLTLNWRFPSSLPVSFMFDVLISDSLLKLSTVTLCRYTVHSGTLYSLVALLTCWCTITISSDTISSRTVSFSIPLNQVLTWFFFLADFGI